MPPYTKHIYMSQDQLEDDVLLSSMRMQWICTSEREMASIELILLRRIFEFNLQSIAMTLRDTLYIIYIIGYNL